MINDFDEKSKFNQFDFNELINLIQNFLALVVFIGGGIPPEDLNNFQNWSMKGNSEETGQVVNAFSIPFASITSMIGKGDLSKKDFSFHILREFISSYNKILASKSLNDDNSQIIMSMKLIFREVEAILDNSIENLVIKQRKIEQM